MGRSADDRRNEKTAFLAEEKKREFPLYLMKVGEKQEFMEMKTAGAALDSWMVPAESLDLVLESDFTVRKITDKERNEMQDIADKHSESK